jgi:anaerobic selenocysteine-containing dehydrogenase
VDSIADLWVKLRPNSDGALAMGLLKVIVEEELYDKEFVKNWCTGFDLLEEELKTFSLKDVEEVTWVPEKTIREFARLYASTKPATIQWGNALDTLQSPPLRKAGAITGHVKLEHTGWRDVSRPHPF